MNKLPWDETLFAWKRVKKKDTAALLKQIKDTLGKCDEIAMASDVDPTGEGQLLAWEVLDELNLGRKQITRMYFMDESPKEIQKAFVNRKPLPPMNRDPEFLKARYRSQFDFLSMQFTRIATAYGDGRSVLRQGRLKSAMVRLVGDQLEAIKNYKKVPFYQNRFRDENGIVYVNPSEPIFPTKDEVPKTYTNSPVVVDSKTQKFTAPPKMLDLAALSSILEGKGYKSKDVLNIYQKMYEAQIVSYPRTEDKVITPEQFNDLLPKVDAIAGVVGVNSTILTHRTPRKTHVKTGGAHGANRPGPNVPKSLDELRHTYGECGALIYELLARNYLATLAEDYEYEAQKGHVQLYPAFVGTAAVPKKLCWKAVFNDEFSDADDDSSKGLGLMADPFVYEGFPPKPAAPTMKWLMKQLESHDVGTGATRTSIYSEVTNEKAQYPLLIAKRGKLSMSQYGDMSYHLLPNTHIGSLKLTEDLQADMRAIAEGKADPAVCLRKMQEMVEDDLMTMQQNGIKMRKELGVVEQGQKEKCTGVWQGKNVSFTREWSGHRFTDEECEKLLNGEEIEINGLISKSGRPYDVIGKLAIQEYKGHKFVGFVRTGFAGSKGIPDEWCGHKFTAAEKDLLQKGESITITDAYSRKNKNTFSCKVSYGLTDNGVMGIVPDFGSKQKGVPDEWCQHKFTEDEKLMLEAGKWVQLDGCISKKGGVFACRVRFGKNDSGHMGIIPDFGN